MTTTEKFETESGVTISVDMGALIGAMIPEDYDYDSDQPMGPTVQAKLLDLVADKLTRDLATEVRAQVNALVNDRIAAAVDETVRETLASGVRKTGPWGEPEGEPVPIVTLIRKEAEQYLTEKVGDYTRRETRVEKLIREEVNARFFTELKKAVDQAKGEALTRVRAAASEIVTETIARAAGVSR